MDTVVAELLSFFQALKSGSLFGYLISLAFVLIGLALTIVAVAYQHVVIKRSQTASKATQENFETIAADLRKRALEVKKRDEGLRKRDLEVKERDELNGFVKELRKRPQRPQQQRQALKGSQRAMKGSVSHIITVGLILQALLRLSSIYLGRRGSAVSEPRFSWALTMRPFWFFSASCPAVPTTSSISRAKLTGSGLSSSLPASIFEKLPHNLAATMAYA
jgi:uncharacterized membrane protein